MAHLPPDVILLICEELGDQRAFGTLFNAALSGKNWAGSALLWMYRVHEQASIRSDDSSETRVSKRESAKTTSKWALQWRSIIMSSLGKTAYPYCLYMRSLDLDNLRYLFNDFQNSPSLYKQFFEDDMQIFLTQTPKRRKPDTMDIINRIGESIAKFTGESADRNRNTAALEELRGDIDKDALPQWISRLPRLKSLTLWKGSVLNKSLADVIKDHCPDFNNLSLYEAKGDQVESELSSFLENLPSNTLRFFQIISYNDIGPQTFLSLNNHHASLKQLMLGSLPAPAIRSLSLLKGCTALQTLELQDVDGRIDLEATENDVFLELIAWLTSCKSLKNISLKNFINGPKILTHVCLENEIKLESLLLVEYPLHGNQDFHRALAHQANLESLYLEADAEDSFRDDTDTLVASLCKLKNLKYLDIHDTSDYFRTTEIQLIAMNLSKLEDFSVGGYDVTDEVWRAISTLPNLRSMSFYALTSFTFDAILEYISTLRPTNAGLQLSVMCASPGSELTEGELAMIRTALAEMVDGKFDFVMNREAESDFSSDSD